MEIIFTDFWAFIAAVILLTVIFEGVTSVVKALRNTNKDDNE